MFVFFWTEEKIVKDRVYIYFLCIPNIIEKLYEKNKAQGGSFFYMENKFRGKLYRSWKGSYQRLHNKSPISNKKKKKKTQSVHHGFD